MGGRAMEEGERASWGRREASARAASARGWRLTVVLLPPAAGGGGCSVQIENGPGTCESGGGITWWRRVFADQ